MADGFARATGRVGTALVVHGPGFYNASGGLVTAHSVHSPVLVVTNSAHHGGPPAEEAEDDLRLLRPLCEWAGRAGAPSHGP
jgi:acetolactate synthase-1/2/3 large subunit